MAQPLRITALNLNARIEGVAKDAREALLHAKGLGPSYKGVQEVIEASNIILDAQKKASKYLLQLK